jgi:poly-gamma-glutamate capsule biosynthesis protein CapA/YwtB (metallophosphatase superfamily)
VTPRGSARRSDAPHSQARTGYRPAVKLFLCGDVMTGRGVDQILSRPGDPRLWERYVHDARGYVELAEAVSGPISRPVDPTWPWGDALRVLMTADPDARVINLETTITQSDSVAGGKAVHYRMHPANVGCLIVARPDACVLANNHVLDFGPEGLADTLDALDTADLPTAGAGADLDQARRPVVVPLPGDQRLIVFAAGARSSGIPPDWAATGRRSGVNLLPDLSAATADGIGEQVRQVKRDGDVVVFSVHWGSNWGYQVPGAQVDFAHRLVDQGVDIVHGHSSHHPRPVEVYRGKLILYGAGDFIDDYEGISGHEEYRDDLRLMYFPTVRPQDGQLSQLTIVPMQTHRMRLRQASTPDSRYLADLLDRVSRPFGARLGRTGDNLLQLTG